jgi:RNA 3'-terminal phosphate cyclase
MLKPFFYLVYEAIGTAATPGLFCQPRVIVKMIVEKQMECRFAGETEVLGENLVQALVNVTVNFRNIKILSA